MLNTIIQALSFVVLLFGSFCFGYLGKPTEMGLSILAGVLSLAFTNIDKISKFKGAGFEAEMRNKVDAMVAKDAEPPSEQERAPFIAKGYSLDDANKRVVQCLGNSKYTWRSVTGVSSEASLPVNTVRQALEWLSSNGLAIQAGIGRHVNWGLTEDGRELFNAIFPVRADT